MTQYLDARSQQSRDALLAAAWKLVAEHPVSELSITQVAAEAGVSRPTFYQHFSDVPALAAECKREMQEVFTRIDDDLQRDDREYLRELLRTYVQAEYEFRAFARNAVNGPSGLIIARDIQQFLDRNMKEHAIGCLKGEDTQAVRDRRAVLSAGIALMVFDWLNSDFTGSNAPDAMADRLADTYFSLIGNGE